MHKALNFIGRRLRVIIIVLLCLSTLAWLGNMHYILEWFSHFRLQYLVIALPCTLFFTFTRKQVMAFLSLLVVLINALPIAFIYAPAPITTIDNSHQSTIKLLFANINIRNQQYQNLLSLIQTQQPDLLVLEEVDKQWLQSLQTLTKNYPTQISEARGDNFGIALFSHLPAKQKQIHYFADTDIPTLEVELEIKGKTITVVATHPVPPLNKTFSATRNRQLTEVFALPAMQKSNTLLIGDLNTSMWSPVYQQLLQRSKLYNSRQGIGILPTWPSHFWPLQIPLDHCLVGSDLAITSMQTHTLSGSDHHALLIELELL